MIPRCLGPVAGVVARFAICGKTRRLMIGIRGVQIFLFMTGIAVRWRIGVRSGMADFAFQADMRPGEREIRLTMVKGSRRPGILGVAGHAVMGKIIAHMIGIRRGFEILPVAGIAIRSDIGVTAGVAFLAIQGFVRPLQRKIRLAMVKGGRRPVVLRVAGHAIVGEIPRLMVGVLDGRKLLLMAAVTIPRQSGHLVVDVATDAFQPGVGALQREAAALGMLKSRSLPFGFVMAELALRGKGGSGVRRQRRRLVVTAMAAHTILREALEGVLGVATPAIRCFVSAAQRENVRMHEAGAVPGTGGHGMANLAIHAEARRRVLGTDGLLVITGVAPLAIQRRAFKLVHLFPLVAGLAIRDGVDP